MQAVFQLAKPVVPHSALVSTMYHNGNQVLHFSMKGVLQLHMLVLRCVSGFDARGGYKLMCMAVCMTVVTIPMCNRRSSMWRSSAENLPLKSGFASFRRSVRWPVCASVFRDT